MAKYRKTWDGGVIDNDDGSHSSVDPARNGDWIVRNPDGSTVRITRDKNGNPDKAYHSDGRCGTFTRDIYGDPFVRYPDGSYTEIRDDYWGDGKTIVKHNKSEQPQKKPPKSRGGSTEGPHEVPESFSILPLIVLGMLCAFFYSIGFTFWMGVWTIFLACILAGIIIGGVLAKTDPKPIIISAVIILAAGIVGNTWIHHSYIKEVEEREARIAQEEKQKEEEAQARHQAEIRQAQEVIDEVMANAEGEYENIIDTITLENGRYTYKDDGETVSTGTYSVYPAQECVDREEVFWYDDRNESGDAGCCAAALLLESDDGKNEKMYLEKDLDCDEYQSDGYTDCIEYTLKTDGCDEAVGEKSIFPVEGMGFSKAWKGGD